MRDTPGGCTGTPGPAPPAGAASRAPPPIAPMEVTMSYAASHTQNGRTPLMFIHGAWLSARSWENYVDYFGGGGFCAFGPLGARRAGGGGGGAGARRGGG